MELPFQFRFWGDQCVVYDPCSGDTHLLNDFAGHLLLCARGETTEFYALVNQTALAMGVEPDDKFITTMESIVIELQSKGLLSHSCCSPN